MQQPLVPILVTIDFQRMEASLPCKSQLKANNMKETFDESSAPAAGSSINFSDPSEVALAGYKAMMEGGNFAQYVEPSAKDKEALNQIAQDNVRTMKEFNTSLKDIKVVKVDENGDQATAEISRTIVMGDMEDTDTNKMKLTKVDGKWYFSASEFE